MAQPCPFFPRCGGCTCRELPYAAQLHRKTAALRRLLRPFGGTVAPCQGGPEDACRNKVHLAFCRQQGAVRAGFFDSRTHRVVPVPRCPMHGDWYETLVTVAEGWANDCSILPYEPRTGKGSLRFLAARCLEGRLMVTVVSQTPRLPALNELHARLEAAFGPTSLWLNINDRRDSAVFSREFRHIAGPKKLRGRLLEVDFELSPDAFFQVNTEMAARLYARILELAGQLSPRTVVDAYSGIGITSLLFARAGIQVVSVEQTPSAVEDARALARRNGLAVRALCGDCARVLPRLRLPGETLFFVDPPRRGLGDSVCRTLLRFAPSHVLYLSCGPESLARDLALLTAGGYRLVQAEPYDLFPHTNHVETVVLLLRETYPQSIEVKIDVSDGEVTEQPTYKRIQEYVEKNYGFKVHTAYIAEVKRMCGLDMHKAPNAVEQRKRQYHPCPPEKVDAIKDALRHFGMI